MSSRKDQKKDASHCVSRANVAGPRCAIFACDSHLHMHASHSMLSSIVGQNIMFHFFFSALGLRSVVSEGLGKRLQFEGGSMC